MAFNNSKEKSRDNRTTPVGNRARRQSGFAHNSNNTSADYGT